MRNSAFNKSYALHSSDSYYAVLIAMSYYAELLISHWQLVEVRQNTRTMRVFLVLGSNICWKAIADNFLHCYSQ